MSYHKLLLAIGLVAIGAWPHAANASCAAPPPPPAAIFTGRLTGEAGEGTAGTLFAFEVDSVQRGQVPERTIVDITVDKRVRGPDGQVLVQSSSNSIGSPPKVGGRYRVEAYRGDPGGHPRLFVNACGGSLRPLAMAATKRPQEPSIPVAVAPLVVVASTAAVYLWRRPWGRRAPDAPAP